MPAASLVAQTLGASGALRRQRPAHRRRAVPSAVLATVGLAALAALVLAIGVAVMVRGHGAPSTRRTAPRAAAPVGTTPTTGPAPVVFVSGDSQQARFQVARTGATIELVAVSSCWVQVRTGSAGGPAVFTATLRQGDRRPLPAGQAVWVRMGNPPGMSVDVNGALLPFPAPASSQPFNLIFEPTG
jgi:hypothetical protein